MQCGVIEVRHSEDVVGYPCNGEAVTECFDCGIPVCDAHAETCALCSQTFCTTCIGFHNAEQHQKKPAAVDTRQRRKLA